MNKLPCTVLIVIASAIAAEAGPAVNVAVIAPSVSTRMEARSILARLGWHETALRDASAILVVVRSMLRVAESIIYRIRSKARTA